MRLSRKFISDYIDIDEIDTKELADNMTKIGNEYDNISKLINANKLVVGEIIDSYRHPESDHLNVCKVDIKSEILNIICGAPNVRNGLKVVVALDGAVLPGGTIKKTTILGFESNGMLCSFAELGLEHKFLSKEDINGIHELPDDAPVGEDAIKYLEMDDEIIDFELTSNRSDLLSMYGLAYEVAAIYGKKVKPLEIKYKENNIDVNSTIKLKVDTKDCYTFLCKRVNNIVIKESPKFIKNRLIACNIRPINNVVDISNYVMLETGQPLHYYDADKLGKVIGVRNALDGEIVKTLDGNKRILTSSDLIITNGKDAVGLAGVMGGYDTEIDENTKNVLIESAIFNPLNIRNTSKKYLRSEASIRFEKTLDVNRTYIALDRSCTLLETYADGSVCKGIVEHNNLTKDSKKIEITLKKICSVLGMKISKKDVQNVFEKLGFNTKVDKDTFMVEVPTRRVDISIEEDLIEEVGRIYGVDNIEGTLPVFASTPSIYDNRKRLVKEKMASLGLNEVMTYSLINEKDVFKFTNDEFGIIKIEDPMTEERTTMRHSLITSLLDVYDYNKARSIKDLNIFEVGKGFSLINGEFIEEYKLACLLTGDFSRGLTREKVDFYVVKGIIEELLDYLGYAKRYSFVIKQFPEEMHPTKSMYVTVNNQIIAKFGAVHPNLYKEEVYVIEMNLDTLFSIKTSKIKYKEYSKFPGISKDLAFIVSKDVTSEQLINTIRQSGGKLLKSTEVFDYYEGDKIDSNKKSIAYTLNFESFEKTLTDEEVNPLIDSIIENVVKRHNAILRDK